MKNLLNAQIVTKSRKDGGIDDDNEPPEEEPNGG